MEDNTNILRFKKRFKDDMRENEIGIARTWKIFKGLDRKQEENFTLGDKRGLSNYLQWFI